jgi:hypothetical protein
MINFTDYFQAIVDHIAQFDKSYINLNPGKIYP